MQAQRGTTDQSKKNTQLRKLHVSCQRAWFALLFSFANCNTLFSLGLGALPVFSSPWQVSHRSDISNMIRLHFHSFTQWLFWDSKQDSLPVTYLVSMVFLNCGGRFHNPFISVSYDSKTRTTQPIQSS